MCITTRLWRKYNCSNICHIFIKSITFQLETVSNISLTCFQENHNHLSTTFSTNQVELHLGQVAEVTSMQWWVPTTKCNFTRVDVKLLSSATMSPCMTSMPCMTWMQQWIKTNTCRGILCHSLNGNNDVEIAWKIIWFFISKVWGWLVIWKSVPFWLHKWECHPKCMMDRSTQTCQLV